MKKNISCGRLVMNKAGIVKELQLINGGGTRNCNWDSIDMDFDEIHERLREKYSIDSKQKSLLYDYQITPLDHNQYRTFYEYIDKNGLQFRQRLLFLCTSENENNNAFNSIISAKRKTTVASQTTDNTYQVESGSSSSSLIKIGDERQYNQQSINKNSYTENLQISYSTAFGNSLNDLVSCLHKLISENNHEDIFIDILKNIYTIQGLSSKVLDRLKQQSPSAYECKEEIYNVVLNEIEKSSQSIKTLIELNKMKISQKNQYLIIMDLFGQFYQNLNILRDRWEYHNGSNRASGSSFVVNPSVDPIPSISVSSSSPSSPYQRSNDKENKGTYSLFKPILKSFDHLLCQLHYRNFKSFYYHVQSLVHQTENFRKNMNLDDNQSLYNAEKMTLSIEKSLIRRMNDEYNRPASYSRNQQLEYSYEKTLKEIKDLLKSIKHYRLKLSQMKRSTTSHWSTPPRPYSQQQQHQPIEHKSIIKLKRKHKRIEDDSSSAASHSSFGDETLAEVAKHAYEQRRNR